MKPLIISSLCLIIFVGAWFQFMHHIDDTLSEMIGYIDSEVYENIQKDDWDTAREQFKRLSEEWHEHKIIYHILSDHGAVRATDLAITKTKEYINSEAKIDALAEVAVVRAQFNFILQNELFSIDNIF